MYLTQFLTIAIIHLLAVASPGPDFLIVTKNSLNQGRRAGIITAFGVALGIGVHILYCLLGIAFIISQSIILFNIFKYIGAGYLIWIGYKSLKSKGQTLTIETQKTTDSVPSIVLIRSGFFVNVFNPKATLFFLAVFTQVISKETPLVIQSLYGLEMVAMTFVWFSFVAFVFSHKLLHIKLNKFSRWIERVGGVLMVGLGIKVVLSHRN